MHTDSAQHAAESAHASTNPRTPAFDLLRVFGALAVVLIHVCGAYREALAEIGLATWVTTIGLNGSSRWAVPLFIMISGALLLADQRHFEWRRFVSRRVLKVVVPFLLWSIVYVCIDAYLRPDSTLWSKLAALPTHPAWYHLGFFYYFIPLYLLIPVLMWARDRAQGRVILQLYLCLWMVGICIELFAAAKYRWPDFFLYSGFLLLGYFLRVSNQRTAALLVVTGAFAAVLTSAVVITQSLAAMDYVPGQWFSYKTVNVALAAAGVFSLGFLLTARRTHLPPTLSRLAENSLGIYLIHPIFLIPLRDLGLRTGLPWLEIPLWFLAAFAAALMVSTALRSRPATAWMVP
ncbi:MAG: acyltransferase [Pseudomarimonas sp.]